MNDSPVGSFKKGVKEAHIYGGGMSGLLMGYFLKKHGHSVSIFEKSRELGGKIHTHASSWGLVETAANAVMASAPVLDLIRELGLPVVEQRENLARKIVRGPVKREGPAISTMPFLTFSELLRFMCRLFSPCPDMEKVDLTVQDFFSPLLGPTVCQEVLSPALGGIYALGADELQFRGLFPAVQASSYFAFFRELKKRKAGRSVSFPGGMGELVAALGEKLKNEIHLGSSPPLDPKVNHCLCTGAREAAELLGAGPLSDLLRRIPYVPLKTSTYFLSAPVPVLDRSFGILFSRRSGFKNLGILHNTAIFPGRVREGDRVFSYTFISKGMAEDEKEEVRHDLSLLGVDLERHFLGKQSTSYQEGIPAYNLERQRTLSSIKEMVPPGVVLFGNYTNGISIRDLVTKAGQFAVELSGGVPL